MNKCNSTCNVEDQAITNYPYSALGVFVLAYLLYAIATVAVS